jgi:hypothetical protein
VLVKLKLVNVQDYTPHIFSLVTNLTSHSPKMMQYRLDLDLLSYVMRDPLEAEPIPSHRDSAANTRPVPTQQRKTNSNAQPGMYTTVSNVLPNPSTKAKVRRRKPDVMNPNAPRMKLPIWYNHLTNSN